jgi:hypothetical protein
MNTNLIRKFSYVGDISRCETKSRSKAGDSINPCLRFSSDTGKDWVQIWSNQTAFALTQ